MQPGQSGLQVQVPRRTKRVPICRFHTNDQTGFILAFIHREQQTVAADVVVQRAMRHTSPETKRRYQLGMTDQVRQAVEKANQKAYGRKKVLRFYDVRPDAKKEGTKTVCNELKKKENSAPPARFERATLQLKAGEVRNLGANQPFRIADRNYRECIRKANRCPPGTSGTLRIFGATYRHLRGNQKASRTGTRSWHGYEFEK